MHPCEGRFFFTSRVWLHGVVVGELVLCLWLRGCGEMMIVVVVMVGVACHGFTTPGVCLMGFEEEILSELVVN